MSLFSAICVSHLNILSYFVPVFIGLSLLFYIISCSRSDHHNYANDQGNKIIRSHGPYLFITAHPDDECMFFSPALLQLLKHHPQNVYLLCVTTGNFYNKGAIRRKEIYKSCEILGLPASNVEVLDNRAFLDGDEKWDLQKLLQEISSYMSSINPAYIFTFDDRGVSSHPNHISLSKASRLLLAEEKSKKKIPVLLELKTVPLYRKYISFVDILPSFASSEILFLSSVTDIFKAQRAMCSHVSQFVWFRALYIVFSRYMMINDFVQVNL